MRVSAHTTPWSVARRVMVVLAVGLVVMVVGVGPAAAITVDWKGNGAEGGFCNDVSQDSTVPAGQQRWLFILTSPDTGPWTLTTDFQNSSPPPAAGVQQGNGSVHFTVFTSEGDKLLSASATNGTANSNLTVSHCEVNGVPPTTAPPTTAPPTTAPPTTGAAPTTAPPTTARAAAPPTPGAPAAPAAPGPAVAVPAPARTTG
jgi:hypothetical protein